MRGLEKHYMKDGQYHVNPASGDVGLCRARYDCPFGDLEQAHFSSAAEARAAYEATREALPRKLRKTAKIFRIGTLEPQEPHFDDLKRLVSSFDKLAPEGRHPRRGALFASPDLASHARWVKGARHMRGDKTSHELTVNPDAVYVYPISVYEDASLAEANGRQEEFEQLTRDYWESGMTLREWQAWADNAKPAPGTWEILVPKEQISATRPVSNRRIIEHAPEELADDVNWALEPRRAAKGLRWGKKNTSEREQHHDKIPHQ